jgi:hypothetical protein
MLKKLFEKKFGNVSKREMDFAMEGVTCEVKLKKISKGLPSKKNQVLDSLSHYVDTYRQYDKEWNRATSGK